MACVWAPASAYRPSSLSASTSTPLASGESGKSRTARRPTRRASPKRCRARSRVPWVTSTPRSSGVRRARSCRMPPALEYSVGSPVSRTFCRKARARSRSPWLSRGAAARRAWAVAMALSVGEALLASTATNGAGPRGGPPPPLQAGTAARRSSPAAHAAAARGRGRASRAARWAVPPASTGWGPAGSSPLWGWGRRGTST